MSFTLTTRNITWSENFSHQVVLQITKREHPDGKAHVTMSERELSALVIFSVAPHELLFFSPLLLSLLLSFFFLFLFIMTLRAYRILYCNVLQLMLSYCSEAQSVLSQSLRVFAWTCSSKEQLIVLWLVWIPAQQDVPGSLCTFSSSDLDSAIHLRKG